MSFEQCHNKDHNDNIIIFQQQDDCGENGDDDGRVAGQAAIGRAGGAAKDKAKDMKGRADDMKGRAGTPLTLRTDALVH